MVQAQIQAQVRPQYGLSSVEGFCQGWGELDQLGDITTEVLNQKYPNAGYLRVSKSE